MPAQRSNDARVLGSQLGEERADTEARAVPKGAKKQICFIGRLRDGRLSSLIGRQPLSYEKERNVTGVLDLWGVSAVWTVSARSPLPEKPYGTLVTTRTVHIGILVQT